MNKTIGSNITHQAGTTDAERLAECGARLREVERERDDYARNLRLVMEEASALHDNDGLKIGRICAILSDFTCPENVILEDAELLARREREQAVVTAAVAYCDASRQWGTNWDAGDGVYVHEDEVLVGATGALYAAVDALGAGEGDDGCQ